MTSSCLCEAEDLWRTFGRSTMSTWPYKLPRHRSPLCRVCGMRRILLLRILWRTCAPPTPTAAAEQVAQSTAHLSAALAGWGVALGRAVTQTLDREAQRCDRLTARLARPSQGVDAQRQRLYRRVRHIMQLVRGRVDGALASWTAQQASYARLVSADMAKRQAALAQLQIRL